MTEWCPAVLPCGGSVGVCVSVRDARSPLFPGSSPGWGQRREVGPAGWRDALSTTVYTPRWRGGRGVLKNKNVERGAPSVGQTPACASPYSGKAAAAAAAAVDRPGADRRGRRAKGIDVVSTLRPPLPCGGRGRGGTADRARAEAGWPAGRCRRRGLRGGETLVRSDGGAILQIEIDQILSPLFEHPSNHM